MDTLLTPSPSPSPSPPSSSSDSDSDDVEIGWIESKDLCSYPPLPQLATALVYANLGPECVDLGRFNDEIRINQGDHIPFGIDSDPFRTKQTKNVLDPNTYLAFHAYLMWPALHIEIVPPPPLDISTKPELEFLLDTCLNKKLWAKLLMWENLGKSFTIRDFISHFGKLLARLQRDDPYGLARTTSASYPYNHWMHCDINCYRSRYRERWHTSEALVRDGEYIGCIVRDHVACPASPNTLLQGELFCLISTLRRRRNDSSEHGHPTVTPHEIAPPAIVLSVSSDKDDANTIWVRVIRATFQDAPYIRRYDIGRLPPETVPLKVELGEYVPFSALDRRPLTHDDDEADWSDKFKTLLRPILNPRIRTSESENTPRRPMEAIITKKEEDESDLRVMKIMREDSDGNWFIPLTDPVIKESEAEAMQRVDFVSRERVREGMARTTQWVQDQMKGGQDEAEGVQDDAKGAKDDAKGAKDDAKGAKDGAKGAKDGTKGAQDDTGLGWLRGLLRKPEPVRKRKASPELTLAYYRARRTPWD